jgi:hypothetical protein
MHVHSVHTSHRCLLEASQEKIVKYENAISAQETEMESLKGEFMKDAVETSDRIEMMNSRLLILSVENSELKTKLRLGENYEYSSPYSRHRNIDEEYEVEEGEGEGGGGGGERWYEEGMSMSRYIEDSVSYDAASFSNKKGSVSVSVQSEGGRRGRGSLRRVLRPIVIDSFSVSTGGRYIGQRQGQGQKEGQGEREGEGGQVLASRGLYVETSRDSDGEMSSGGRGRGSGGGGGEGAGGRQSVEARERERQRSAEKQTEGRDTSRVGEKGHGDEPRSLLSLRRGEMEMEVEESITESLTRASVIINSIRDAARHTPSHPISSARHTPSHPTGAFSSGTASPTPTPPHTHTPTAVLIDRESLLVAVEALSEEIKLAQLQVHTVLHRIVLHCAKEQHSVALLYRYSVQKCAALLCRYSVQKCAALLCRYSAQKCAALYSSVL